MKKEKYPSHSFGARARGKEHFNFRVVARHVARIYGRGDKSCGEKGGRLFR